MDAPLHDTRYHALLPSEASVRTEKPLVNVDSDTEARSPRHLQVPFALSRPVLATAFVGFALIFITLQIIDSYARSHYGLATSSSNLHYLWTYGPTAGMRYSWGIYAG